MRSAEDLIKEVLDICDAPDLDADGVLSLLNVGQLVVAERLLLPGLSNGQSTVQTVVNGSFTQMPDDYHKCLNIVLYGEHKKDVDIFRELKSLNARHKGFAEGLSGDVVAVAVHSDGNCNLHYHRQPDIQADLELFYYRKPVPMAESSSSFPDGFPGGNENYSQTLVYFACWHVFQRIEQGLEGNKNDTAYYKSLFDEYLGHVDLDSYRTGKMFPEPSINRLW